MADIISKLKAVTLDQVNGSADPKFPKLNDEQESLGAQFEVLSKRFNEPESLVALNNSLREQTFIVGNTPSVYDALVFKNVLPYARKWSSVDDIASYRHILRWVELVQNTLVSLDDNEKVTVDLDLPVPREIKEKKKPAKQAEKPKDEAKANSKAKKDVEPADSEEAKKAKAEAQKAKKAAKAKAKADAQAKVQAAAVLPDPSMVDFRVGFIQKAVKHPNADSLYMSTIDMGDEEGPRTVCSGLVKYIPLEEMQERYVIVIANLKPVTMRGVKSCAMVLCASNDSTVEFVNPPPGSKAGDKIFFEGHDGTPEKVLNPKKKIFETVQPKFSTNENFEVTYTEEGQEPKKLMNAKGELCRNSTIVSADVK